jgi:hypothetical protein
MLSCGWRHGPLRSTKFRRQFFPGIGGPLIATLSYSFARISAALRMRVEDLYARGGWELRLREKYGKPYVIPCHDELDEDLHA